MRKLNSITRLACLLPPNSYIASFTCLNMALLVVPGNHVDFVLCAVNTDDASPRRQVRLCNLRYNPIDPCFVGPSRNATGYPGYESIGRASVFTQFLKIVECGCGLGTSFLVPSGCNPSIAVHVTSGSDAGLPLQGFVIRIADYDCERFENVASEEQYQVEVSCSPLSCGLVRRSGPRCKNGRRPSGNASSPGSDTPETCAYGRIAVVEAVCLWRSSSSPWVVEEGGVVAGGRGRIEVERMVPKKSQDVDSIRVLLSVVVCSA